MAASTARQGARRLWGPLGLGLGTTPETSMPCVPAQGSQPCPWGTDVPTPASGPSSPPQTSARILYLETGPEVGSGNTAWLTGALCEVRRERKRRVWAACWMCTDGRTWRSQLRGFASERPSLAHRGTLNFNVWILFYHVPVKTFSTQSFKR